MCHLAGLVLLQSDFLAGILFLRKSLIITISIDRYVLMDFPINDEKQKAELRKAIKNNFAALIDYWAIDWDYDGITFKSIWQAILRKAIKNNFAALIDYWAIDWDYDGITFKSIWQAIRGNGKRANTVITIASSPQLSAGKRAIAVQLVDVFGNDASATVEVRDKDE